MPAHRPLSVYAALEQLFGGAMEDSSSTGGGEVSVENYSEPSSSKTHRLAASDGSFPTKRNDESLSGLTETKRNRSMYFLCFPN